MHSDLLILMRGRARFFAPNYSSELATINKAGILHSRCCVQEPPIPRISVSARVCSVSSIGVREMSIHPSPISNVQRQFQRKRRNWNARVGRVYVCSRCCVTNKGQTLLSHSFHLSELTSYEVAPRICWRHSTFLSHSRKDNADCCEAL